MFYLKLFPQTLYTIPYKMYDLWKGKTTKITQKDTCIKTVIFAYRKLQYAKHSLFNPLNTELNPICQ